MNAIINAINMDLPRRVLVINAGIAALAAVGITLLAGAEPALSVPFLTAVLTLALLARASTAEGRGVLSGDVVVSDPHTGLATAEVAQEALAREFSAAQRGRPLTIVLLRLEGLPKIRARHGDAVAGQVVRVAGRTLASHRRGMHLAAPHGVREGTFMSILSGSDRQGASVYAARLRSDLMQMRGVPSCQGVSIGIASYDASMAAPSDLVRTAAYALEKGSEAGGKVMVVGERS